MRVLRLKYYFNQQVRFDEVYRINYFNSKILNKTFIIIMN